MIQRRSPRLALLTVGVAILATVAGPSRVFGDQMLDDFEFYELQLPADDPQGANYVSALGDPTIHHIGPTWNRFGHAVADGVFVTNRTSEVFSGTQGGTLFANWDLGDQFNAVYLTSGLDVRTAAGYRIDIRSNGSSGNQGAGVIATFAGTNGQAWIADLTKVTAATILGDVTGLYFAFDPELFEEVNKPASEADFLGTLSSLSWIGIQIRKEGSTGEEGFSIDQLALVSQEGAGTVPEPTSALVWAAGGLALVMRRSRCA